MKITEEAVEAAARGIYSTAHPGGQWESRPDRHIRHLELATDALEAAAPYMLGEVQWGVRDKDSNAVAGHPSKESADEAVAAHPDWYETVSRPWPNPNPPWTATP